MSTRGLVVAETGLLIPKFLGSLGTDYTVVEAALLDVNGGGSHNGGRMGGVSGSAKGAEPR